MTFFSKRYLFRMPKKNAAIALFLHLQFNAISCLYKSDGCANTCLLDARTRTASPLGEGL
jgi:hypothetical protein